MQSFGTNHVVYLLLATRWTVALSAIAFLGGGALGAVLALLQVQPASRALRIASGLFIRLFQVTPLLMQLFLFYFGLSIMGLSLDAWTSVSIALIFYTGAFLGDIWQGCIKSVPAGQAEAAKALALTYRHMMTYVVLPQAVRVALPPTVGFLVQVVKSTSLAAIVGFAELIRASQMVNNVTLRPLLVYTLVMAIYFVLCWPLSMLSRTLERRLSRDHPAPRHPEAPLLDPRLQDVSA